MCSRIENTKYLDFPKLSVLAKSQLARGKQSGYFVSQWILGKTNGLWYPTVLDRRSVKYSTFWLTLTRTTKIEFLVSRSLKLETAKEKITVSHPVSKHKSLHTPRTHWLKRGQIALRKIFAIATYTILREILIFPQMAVVIYHSSSSGERVIPRLHEDCLNKDLR